MGACFTFAAPYTIEPTVPLSLRYGLWVHAGRPTPEQIDAQFESFSKVGPPAAPAGR
jgi:hypothetical protein